MSRTLEMMRAETYKNGEIDSAGRHVDPETMEVYARIVREIAGTLEMIDRDADHA